MRVAAATACGVHFLLAVSKALAKHPVLLRPAQTESREWLRGGSGISGHRFW